MKCLASISILFLTGAATLFGRMERVAVAPDGSKFILEKSKQEFRAIGFNYDHDRDGRLIEDYWEKEWPVIEEDFREMRDLGAQVLRIHLQFGRFMDSPTRANSANLKRLRKLLDLAERTGLRLDLTGLACYHKKHIPAWYDSMTEKERWNAQAVFWEAVAGTCSGHPAVFCYDLMNEPVVRVGEGQPGLWLGPPLGESYFVQIISGEQGTRNREDIARDWIRKLTAAVRKKDRKTPITVGLVDWSLNRPRTLYSGFDPKIVGPELDFIAVHLYPKNGKIPEDLERLRGFRVGKPVVIEETFTLNCSAAEFRTFLDGARRETSGLIGFYWGKATGELERSNSIGDKILLGWLKLFQEEAKAP